MSNLATVCSILVKKLENIFCDMFLDAAVKMSILKTLSKI